MPDILQKASIVQYFDQLASTWDEHQIRNEARLNAILDYADIRAGARVLDIGCGCGASTLAIAERVGAGGRVLGVDISQAMIAEA